MNSTIRRNLKPLGLLAIIVAIGFVFAGLSLADHKPNHKPGGGGGELITNPALVYKKVWDGSLFLITADGSSKAVLAKAKGSEELSQPTWSPDGQTIAGWPGRFRLGAEGTR